MKKATLFALTLLFHRAFCQSPNLAPTDSLSTLDLGEVVITATRTSQLLADVPVPLTLISSEQIRSVGSVRLNDILAEQTGLAIVQELGQGIQMQGLDPDYTLILIDGEPLTGRRGGTLDLSRVAVGNIKQIEVVKGASSSLYGSEAMAGVINIITEKPSGVKAEASARYGTNQTADFNAKASFQKDQTGVSIFVNRFSSNGYDFTPEFYGQTVEPFVNYTVQTKVAHRFSKSTELTVAGRFFEETQQSRFAVAGNQENKVQGEGNVRDWSINPVITQKLGDAWKIHSRFYLTRYRASSELYYESDGMPYDETFFLQGFTRPEVQAEFFPNEEHGFTAGVGATLEHVEATRYDGRQAFQTVYGFGQHEWTPSEKWSFVTGFRFDRHNVFGQQLSPKLAIKHQLTSWMSLQSSVGMGFKAPDFRQLALNFSNSVTGYEVFGVLELEEGLAALQADGLIAELLIDPQRIGQLKAERSRSINIGLNVDLPTNGTLKINAFHNRIGNLIETQAIARKTNGQQVFSYLNLDEVMTQGLELNWQQPLNHRLKLMTGYQWLDTRDQAVWNQLKAGEVFRRDPETLQTRRVTTGDYGGLFNRSRHMGNARLFYENVERGWQASLRAVYRGRFGFGDRNGNQILDDEREYVEGYTTLHFSVGKTINQNLRVQVGCDNLLNYRDEIHLPTLPGRLIWGTLAFQVSKKS